MVNSSNKVRWNTRRKMAWVSLWSIILITVFLVLYPDDSRIIALAAILQTFYVVMTTIIGSYVGFTTLEEIKMGNKFNRGHDGTEENQ